MAQACRLEQVHMLLLPVCGLGQCCFSVTWTSVAGSLLPSYSASSEPLVRVVTFAGSSTICMAAVDSLVEVASSAVFDSQARALVVHSASSGHCQSLGSAESPASMVLGGMLAGFAGHVDNNHVKALQQLSGAEGMAALAHALVAAIEAQLRVGASQTDNRLLLPARKWIWPGSLVDLPTAVHSSQGPLSESLFELQQLLPIELHSAPAFEQRVSAVVLLDSCQELLSGVLEQHHMCHGALAALQAAGNCLALLQLVEAQMKEKASPAFMQVLHSVVGGLHGIGTLLRASAITHCLTHMGNYLSWYLTWHSAGCAAVGYSIRGPQG